MKLNDMTCLKYDVGSDAAVVTVSGTNLEAIKALPDSEDLMLYDGVGNPLYSLDGFNKIVSIRILMDQNASEIVFGKTDTAFLELKKQNAELKDRFEALEKAHVTLKDSISLLNSKMTAFSTKIGSLNIGDSLITDKEISE